MKFKPYDIVACERCKWIGFNKNLVPVPYNVYTGRNPIPQKENISGCPKCNMTYLLVLKPIGIKRFLMAYFKRWGV